LLDSLLQEMSRLWSSLKSVVTVAARVEEMAVAARVEEMAVAASSQAGSSCGVFSHLATVKPHSPLIRFRAGQEAGQLAAAVQPGLPTPAATAAPADLLEWWELPSRYRRRDIEELECEAINMGGREAPFC